MYQKLGMNHSVGVISNRQKLKCKALHVDVILNAFLMNKSWKENIDDGHMTKICLRAER